ncbi:MAG: hypothetical protein K9M97_04210 [Akkermansiaceae bacterium]|nr:hypothetical protein [Akkermansiaceae bacterium]
MPHSDPDTSPTPAHRHAAWNIWNNPIFRRYCQSRLRLRGMGITILLTVLVAGFLVAIAAAVRTRGDFSPVDSARGPIIPLLVVQGLILFVLGTAQVAGGMTAERDEGVIDYQRLIPMSPLAKVMGYLFGLPVREYVMFLATLPFMAWCLWQGEVSWRVWLPLYTAFFTSTLLYYLTGLVTGTVVRNRRWAFLISIGLVFALYTVIPQMSRFGLVFFKYLTTSPVFAEALPGILPKDAGAVVATVQRLLPTVKFFNLDFSETVFTLFTQGGLILTFLVSLCRKWRRDESHLLGKIWALGFFIWVQVLLLGNALPLIEPGNLFPSREFNRMMRLDPNWQPAVMEAMALSAIYGLLTLGMLHVISSMITPTVDRQIQGWRRARKLGHPRIPWLTDAGSGWWFSLAMALAGGVGWYIFTRAVVESRWFPGQVVPLQVLGYFTALLFGVGVGFQALLETRGGPVARLTAILVGVVPLMVGAVFCVIGETFYPIGVWVIGISPFSQPFYAAGSVLPISDLPDSIARAVPLAFKFWLLVFALGAGWLARDLLARRKTIAEASMQATGAEPIEGA